MGQSKEEWNAVFQVDAGNRKIKSKVGTGKPTTTTEAKTPEPKSPNQTHLRKKKKKQ